MRVSMGMGLALVKAVVEPADGAGLEKMGGAGSANE